MGLTLTSLPVPVILFIAYLIGSIPFGLILTKFFIRQDIRKIGSGNIGATNVLRTGNKKLAFITLFLDVFKAAVAIYIFDLLYVFENDPCGILNNPSCYASSDDYSEADTTNMFGQCTCSLDYIPVPNILAGLCAIIGHCYPIWLKFKGGKGVATAFGVLLAAVPWVGLIAAGVWAVTFFLARISSLAALAASGVAPIFTFFIYGAAPAFVVFLIAALIFWRHRGNIGRLRAGTEPRIGVKKEEG